MRVVDSIWASIMLKLETKSELEALHTGNVKESISLEYKASPAIDKKDDKKKLEMARDVSAFANADGGQIVYGMTEKDHEPAGLDQGIDGEIYPGIWFEQVLQQHITPAIPGLRIQHVPLGKTMVAVVITIPATKADPHQVDGRYYRRHNFNRLTMEHYEVRDAFRRAVDPDLVIEFDLFKGDAAYKNVTFNEFRDVTDPIPLGGIIKNNSNQPAMYTAISILIDRRVKIADRGEFEHAGSITLAVNVIRTHMRRMLGIPGGHPIFREMPIPLGIFAFTVSDRLLGQKLSLGYQVRSPGCFKENHGHIELGMSGQMFLRMPPN
jgi:Schlafen, AlbA_2